MSSLALFMNTGKRATGDRQITAAEGETIHALDPSGEICAYTVVTVESTYS